MFSCTRMNFPFELPLVGGVKRFMLSWNFSNYNRFSSDFDM